MNKKVYITSLHLLHGGIEMAITLLANALVKKEYEVEIICTYNLGEPVYKLDERVQVTYLTNVRPNKKELKQAIQTKNPLHLMKEGVYASKVLYLKQKTMQQYLASITEGTVIATRNEHAVLLSKYGQKNVRKIAQLHEDHRFREKLIRDFKNNYENIDVFVLLTDWLKDEIKEMMKKNHHTKHVVIPNFFPEIKTNTEHKRENQVIAVGRMHEVKGFLRMLEAWKETKTTEHYVLKIVGDGDEYVKVKQKITELGLTGRVVLTGALDHAKVMEEMGKSKAYLMTSFTEAFPFVLIEAMSEGLPVVAYDVRVGPRAMIDNGVNGYLVPDGEKSIFAEKIESILNNSDVLEKMSTAAFAKAECFTEEKVVRQWEEII